MGEEEDRESEREETEWEMKGWGLHETGNALSCTSRCWNTRCLKGAHERCGRSWTPGTHSLPRATRPSHPRHGP